MGSLGLRDGFVILDRLGRVVVVTPSFANAAGMAPGDLVGQPFIRLFDAAQFAGFAAGMDAKGAQRAEARPASISHEVLAAQEAERKRISADLHDGLGQLLGAAKFGVESAMCALGRDEVADARSRLADVAGTIRQAVEEVRKIAMNLRPSTLDDLGILATLTWFLREFRAIYRDIEVSGHLALSEAEVPDRCKVAIFRVVQEAMNNVAKHSRATRVCVRLERCAGDLRLEIEDDGVGFDPQAVAARRGTDRRLGHSCARERAESSGGTFALRAAPGAGVSIAVTWPLAMPTEEGRGEPLADHDRRGPYAAAHGTEGAAVPGPGHRGRR